MQSQPSATKQSPRQHVTDWFVGHFDKGAILCVNTNTGSRYQLTILPGSAGKRQVRNEDVYSMRRAWVIRNGQHVPDVTYVGFHLPTARFGLFGADMQFLGSSSTIAGEPTITPFDPPRR